MARLPNIYNHNHITIHLTDDDYAYLHHIAEVSGISVQRLVEPGVKELVAEYKQIEEKRREQLYREGYGPIIW